MGKFKVNESVRLKKDVLGVGKVGDLFKVTGSDIQPSFDPDCYDYYVVYALSCDTDSIIRYCIEDSLYKHTLEVQAPVEEVDMVNSPTHYTVGGIETIDFIKAKLTEEEFKGYIVGNVIKYMARAGNKGDAKEDMAKAKKYLEIYLNS